MTATDTSEVTPMDTAFLRELGQQLRVDSIRCSTAAGSGHPTSSMSAADPIAVLLSRHLVYDWSNPGLPTNDHLIYSKGHASPLCYAMFKAAGVITDEELLTYRTFGSRLEGHHPGPPLGGRGHRFARPGYAYRVDVRRGYRQASGWGIALRWTTSPCTRPAPWREVLARMPRLRWTPRSAPRANRTAPPRDRRRSARLETQNQES